MKKNVWILWIFTGLCAIFFSGCLTAKAVTTSQNNNAGRSMVVISDDATVWIGGIRIDRDFLGQQNFIFPAGKHTVTVRDNLQFTTMETHQGRRYIPYTAIWNTEYEFKPEKSYKINVSRARLRYVNGNLISDDSRVRIVVENRRPTVYFEGDNFITISEYSFGPSGGLIGTTYIGPYFNSNTDFLLWNYGPGLGLNAGPRLGLQMISGKIDLKLVGEAGIGAGIFYHLTPESFGGVYNYYYSGMIDFSFPGIVIGTGYGMLNEQISFLDNDTELKNTFPYVEINLRKLHDTDWIGGGSAGIFARYYFINANDWYNKFAFGIRAYF
ncbi:MAG: hypothetical protein FWD14_04610 [Treponema sp.]|nr:hypothetical protein [Treponema sp.]